MNWGNRAPTAIPTLNKAGLNVRHSVRPQKVGLRPIST